MTPLAMPDGSVVNHKLAVDGSSPVIPQANRKTIFPNITKEDLFQMMISVQQSPEAVVKEFAEKYRQRVGAAFAIPTASGTSSLHVPDSGDPRSAVQRFSNTHQCIVDGSEIGITVHEGLINQIDIYR